MAVATSTWPRELATLFRPEQALLDPSLLVVYECDGFTLERNRPDAVVFPESTEDVVRLVNFCRERKIALVPRGAGTSLSGGTLPLGGGVTVCFTRMKAIEEIRVEDRFARVQPGVVNVHLTQALKGTGFHYAPDPSSQGACTVGGNVATNSGGPHTLKYGVTADHVLAVEMVLPDGQVVRIGSPTEEGPGIDLLGPVVGSEGTLGIVTKVWVRLTPDPESIRTAMGIFDRIDDATEAVTDVIAEGMLPAALEMMDRGIIRAVEEAFHHGFPLDAEAILFVEVDGPSASLDRQMRRIEEIFRRRGVREIRTAVTPTDRQKLWKCRKQAFGAIGRLSPSFCTQDGVVPRTQLPHILRFIGEVSQRFDVRIVNVFHAGDGNIHPILLFDDRDEAAIERALAASDAILRECIACGGCVTGEHGIGVEKLSLIEASFTPDDIDVMRRLRDAFNPDGSLSPGKKLPDPALPHVGRVHPGRRAAL